MTEPTAPRIDDPVFVAPNGRVGVVVGFTDHVVVVRLSERGEQRWQFPACVLVLLDRPAIAPVLWLRPPRFVFVS